MKLNLFGKMVILLAVPLLIQVLAICYFGKIYSEISSALRYQTVAMQAVRSVSALSVILLEVSSAVLRGAMESDKDMPQEEGTYGSLSFNPRSIASSSALFDSDGLSRTLDELDSSGQPYPELMKVCHSLATETRELINEWTTKALEGHRPTLTTVKQASDWTDRYTERIEWLMERPTRYALDNYLANNVRRDIVIALIVIVFCHLTAAFLLSFIIRRNIVSYIGRLAENFDRLGQNKPLLGAISGDDELARFDRSIHGVLNDVVVARLERQEYLMIMNSIMRKPLVELEEFLRATEKQNLDCLSDKGKNALSGSVSNIKRLVAMLNELIDFEQIEQGTLSLNYQETTAREVIDNAIDCVQYRVKESQEFVQELRDEVPLNADPDRLLQVLINLLTNALKFSPPNSVVTVGAVRSSNSVTFTVRDQGRGIPPDKLDKIFLRFEQVEHSDSTKQKGSGLGLAICKTIVEAHGGEIWAENNNDKGASFSFSIPVEPA